MNFGEKKWLDELREKLAELEHDQWVAWSRSLVASENISTERVERWSKFWVPYKKLSEEQKETDRVWADRVMKLLEGYETFSEFDLKVKEE